MPAPLSATHWSYEEPIPQEGRPRSAARTFILQHTVKSGGNFFTFPKRPSLETWPCMPPAYQNRILRFGLLGKVSAAASAAPLVLLSAPVRVSILLMTDKQAVIDALTRLPEDASFEEITEELRIMGPSGADEPTSRRAALRPKRR